MIFKKLFVLFLVIVGSGCATPLVPPSGRVESLATPAQGMITTSELGDSLMSKTIRTTIPSVELVADYQPMGGLGIGHFINAGVCIPKGSRDGEKLYAPSEYTVVGGPMDGKTPPEQFSDFMVFSRIGTDLCWLGQEDLCVPRGDWRDAAYIDYSKPYFEQELIYNGRVGDDLKFIYREFSGQLARGSFTQEIQYDLGESPIIGFKGARLEVLEATNRQITYKVISHFP